MQMSADIIIPIHNAPRLVQRCLRSVEGNVDPGRHRVILVDDSSDGPTVREIQRFCASRINVTLARNSRRRGYTKSANVGLRISSGAMAVVLNSDTEVSAGWLDKLGAALFGTPGVGIVGPLSNAASYQSIPRYHQTVSERAVRQTPINPLPHGMTVGDVNRYLESTKLPTPVRVPLVHGFCMAIRREVLEEIGHFDEVLFPDGFGEETDYCLRATDAGWGLALATDTYVWHSKTGSYSVDHRTTLVTRARATLTEKYGPLRLMNASAAMEATAHRLSQRTKQLSGPNFPESKITKQGDPR